MGRLFEHPLTIVVLLVIVLLLFGAKRLPDLASGIGQSLKIFKREVRDLSDDDDPRKDATTPPVATTPVAPAATVTPVAPAAVVTPPPAAPVAPQVPVTPVAPVAPQAPAPTERDTSDPRA
ncbi:twin-arginine translocase TatA/TatE family subunit [Cellulomonas hominis]|uniref:twin-arginine translocase TatA/TatE family subunit n=1 Tax=Cellulomonas hominis TaxID=156981 RepID=UPI001B90D1E5|nr:twin-arginine translocase TatA/TatE family subunit [Cellulomonas hominis]VTR75628.1 Sec-independent protein translocase protein TatA [Cellulomonas hominis]